MNCKENKQISMYMMLIHALHVFELPIETNFQCMTHAVFSSQQPAPSWPVISTGGALHWPR